MNLYALSRRQEFLEMILNFLHISMSCDYWTPLLKLHNWNCRPPPVICMYICSAQSKNRYNSGIVLRKVGILTLSANSGIVPDNSRIAQGRIPTLRRTILELYRFSLCAEHIHVGNAPVICNPAPSPNLWKMCQILFLRRPFNDR